MQVFHGTIITCDENDNVFSYLVENKGKIAHVGNHLPEIYTHTEPIELGQKALIPSFGDGHIHFSNWALIAGSFFDVRSARNFSEMGRLIETFIADNEKSKLVLCFGASKHCVEEKRLITRGELDEFCPAKPLVMICYDGHSCIVNSQLLNKLPEKAHKMRGFNRGTGQLFNEAYYFATDFSTSMIPVSTLVRSIIKGYDLLVQKGIGMIHPVEGIGFPMDMDVRIVSLIARAQTKRNRFQTRLFFQTMDPKKVLKRKLPRIGGCFATALDGCFGACDAALLEPYSNDPHNRGILFNTDAEVIHFAKEANRAGLQIEMHAIGDAATRQAVMAIEAALKDFPRADHRHTLIHASLMSPEDLEKCARLEIGITLQPGFLISPLEPVEYLEKILGSRIKSGSPLRHMVDSGIHLSTGSDAPVTDPDPIEAIHGACNHPYDAGQSVSIQRALKMATYEVAWTSFDEQQRGSLKPGKIADMVVLNKNPLPMEPKDLLSLKTDGLYLAGKKYTPDMSIFTAITNGTFGSNRNI